MFAADRPGGAHLHRAESAHQLAQIGGRGFDRGERRVRVRGGGPWRPAAASRASSASSRRASTGRARRIFSISIRALVIQSPHVGRARDEGGVGMARDERGEALLGGGGGEEAALVARGHVDEEVGAVRRQPFQRAGGGLAMRGEAPVPGLRQRVERGVDDRPVAGAAAQVARERVVHPRRGRRGRSPSSWSVNRLITMPGVQKPHFASRDASPSPPGPGADPRRLRYPPR